MSFIIKIGLVLFTALSFYLFVYLIIKIYFKIKLNRIYDFKNIKFIIDIDDNGFGIFNKKTNSSYLWSAISKLTINEDYLKVSFLYIDKKIELNKNFIDYFKFLKSIPKQFNTNTGHFFDQLHNCQICGLTAILNTKCLECHNKTYRHSLFKEKMTETKYIIKQQLQIFAPFEETDPIKLYKEPTTFKQTPDWKPLVNHDDVLNYSKKNYWSD